MRRDAFFWIGSAAAISILAATLAAPLLSLYNPQRINSGQELLPPGAIYRLGTDSLGRDVLSRSLWGGRASIINAILATSVAAGGGVIVGGLAGMFGGWVDLILMRGVDVMLSVPGLLLAIALVAFLGVGQSQAALAVGISLAPGFARVVRVAVIGVLQEDYIVAARAIGATRGRIFTKHVLPNISPTVLGFIVVNFGWALLNLATLDFLGLTGSPSDPTWGRMLAEGRRHLRRAPWIALVPGMMLTALVAAVVLTGDAWQRIQSQPKR